MRSGRHGIVWLVVGAGLAASCEPAAEGEARLQSSRVGAGVTADPEARAPAETTVRRVLVPVRRASAMQRVTGPIAAQRAHAPLDSTLAIRVLDQRGAELGGVAVRWTLEPGTAASGARLRVLEDRTDTLGVARAVLVPGATADDQVVAAEVANVGRIDFRVTVPVKSIRLEVADSDRTVWPGEIATVRAALRDDGGTELSGGRPGWASADTSTLELLSSDGPEARIRGRLAGAGAIVGWVGELRARTTLEVRPTLAGRFHTLGGDRVPDVRMRVHAGALAESVAVQDGRFALRAMFSREADVDIHAQAAGYQDVHVRVRSPRDLQRLEIALVPMSWRIDAGSYAGTEIAIDARGAMRRAGSSPFWRLVPLSGTGPRTLLGWREEELPLRLAFHRARSGDRITDADSSAFWSAARQVEADLGGAFFTPAEIADSARARVIPVEIGAQGAEGHTFLSWGRPGHADDGVVRFRSTATLRDRHVVTHELLHLLGFGHATAWQTVAQPTHGREERLTPHDVAYAQLAMRLRRFQRATGALPGLPIAVQ